MRSSAASQLAIAVAVGAIAAVVLALLIAPGPGLLIGYDVAALCYLARLWSAIWPLDATETARRARSEDPTRPVSDAVILLAAVTSLVGIGVLAANANSDHGVGRDLRITLAVASVLISWLLLHSIYALRYARAYYGGEEGGIDFNMSPKPPYTDFAYLAFTLGMTFQVSDTSFSTSRIRRIALGHAMLSFGFGTVIVATTINLVAGLVR